MYVATLGLPTVAPANIFLELYTWGLMSRYVCGDSWSSDGCAG